MRGGGLGAEALRVQLRGEARDLLRELLAALHRELQLPRQLSLQRRRRPRLLLLRRRARLIRRRRASWLLRRPGGWRRRGQDEHEPLFVAEEHLRRGAGSRSVAQAV